MRYRKDHVVRYSNSFGNLHNLVIPLIKRLIGESVFTEELLEYPVDVQIPLPDYVEVVRPNEI